MSVQESSATALIRFTGLGIICFNQERQRGEVAAIRDNKHVLTIKIQQPVYQDGAEKDIVVYKDVATYQDLPKEDVTLEIKAVTNPAIKGYEIYQPGDFDRLDSPDINDFRWIVSMDNLHGAAALAPAARDSYPITKIYVGNGLFYTHKLDRNLFFEKLEKDEKGAAVRREVFGNVGETMGVKIEGEEVSFTIRIGDREETHSLRRVAGLPFRIEITNMDHSDNAVYSDMADYYKYVASPNGTEFDLAPVVEETDGEVVGTGVNTQEFCHPIVVDLRSIDDL
ncbi:MAG TPA: hypothetical protein VGO73_04915 [Pyrinomonadaceae bacterium]|jgi:hypothetical protein|nr:hypothetical protein [Pyrinomonadaceae bacterium]